MLADRCTLWHVLRLPVNICLPVIGKGSRTEKKRKQGCFRFVFSPLHRFIVYYLSPQNTKRGPTPRKSKWCSALQRASTRNKTRHTPHVSDGVGSGLNVPLIPCSIPHPARGKIEGGAERKVRREKVTAVPALSLLCVGITATLQQVL